MPGGPDGQAGPVRLEAKDIRYIHEELSSESWARKVSLAFQSLLLANLAGMGFVGFGLFQRRQEQILSRDSALKRKKIARTLAGKRMKTLKQLARSQKPEEAERFVGEAEKLLTEYLSNKFNLSGYQFTTRWVEDQQSGAVELLLTTSMSAEEILHGHMLALRRMFGLPALALGVVELVSLASGARISKYERDAGILALTFLVVFFSDLHTLAWVGTWQSMLRRRANRAFLHALLRVLVLPWFIFGIFIFLGAPNAGGTVAFFYFGICSITNLVLYKTSRDGLRDGFRLAAAEQYQTGGA